MRRGLLILTVCAVALGGCNPMDMLFPEDPRLGEEPVYMCVGRVRADMTYEAYQELENAPGRFVPTYTYDITRLDLEAVQGLLAKGADETAGTRLMQQNNDTGAAVERFKRMSVDEKGALFLGREPALYRVRGRAQPANTILESGCERQEPNMRLVEVTWSRGGGASAATSEAPDPEPEAEIVDLPNLGGVR